MYYKSPEIAPLAQPANPLEATTGVRRGDHRTPERWGTFLGGAG